MDRTAPLLRLRIDEKLEIVFRNEKASARWRFTRVRFTQFQFQANAARLHHGGRGQRDRFIFDDRAAGAWLDLRLADLLIVEEELNRLLSLRRLAVARDVSRQLDLGAADVIIDWRAREDHVLPLQPSQVVRVDFLVAEHIQQPVAFPVQVGEFGDRVALNRSVFANLFDFAFERNTLAPLRGAGQIVEASEHAVELEAVEAVEDSGGPGHFAPVEIALEPPGQFLRQD